jgi:hypothetical protein
VWPLILAFIEIALHRRGPESLPSSRFFVLGLLALDLPLGIIVLALRGVLGTYQFAFLLLDTLLYFGFIFAVLRFFGRDRRFSQTAGALIGTDLLINALSLPVTFAATADGAIEQGSPLLWLYLALFLWWIDVAGYILSRALEQAYIVGLMFVILYVMTSFSLNSLLIPTSS